MITTILDGGAFDDIKAMRWDEGSQSYIEVSIKDLTKEELMDVARTYYLSLQEINDKMTALYNKLENKLNPDNKSSVN